MADASRRSPDEAQTPEEVPLIAEVREALDAGHPLDLLGLVGVVILGTTVQPLRKPEEQAPGIGDLVAAFTDVPAPETTALLAVLGELLIDDAEVRDRCRQAAAARDDTLPGWLAGLDHTTVHRAVRMAHVLGDGDEVLLGVRFADEQEMTGVVSIDHSMASAVADAFFVPGSIGDVLAVAQANNVDPDTTFADIGLADARAGLEDALDRPLSAHPLRDSDTWPACRALVRWLVGTMPAGGANFHVAQWSPAQTAQFCDRFFATPVGARFDSPEYRRLLRRCAEDGTGDPSRWSATRLRRLLSPAVIDDETLPRPVQLDLPDLLRAFVPFAHAESGIRQELTDEATAAIAESADDYRAAVLGGG